MTGRRSFNVVHIVQNYLIPFLPGGLKIELFDKADNQPAASVSYEPTTLHIDRETWRDAHIGDPQARYIVAHEIGHIVMHGHAELAFSNVGENRLKAPPMEESVEDQANIFAHFLLVPDEALIGNRSLDDLAAEISVRTCVIATVQAYDPRRNLFEFLSANEYAGDSCNDCGNFTLVRNGTDLRCDTCGSTTAF